MQDFYLIHSRTKGSKNGVRRYQNKDGTLTPAGEIRYLGHRVRNGNVSREFEEELEFNSQTNVYPSNNKKDKPKRVRPQSKMDQIDRKIPHNSSSKQVSRNHNRTKSNVSREFEEELEFNSQTNKYPQYDEHHVTYREPPRISAIFEGLQKVLDRAKEETKKHIDNYFKKSFDKHFAYQMVPPRGADAVNHLIPYTNREASEALGSYIDATANGSIGKYINTFIQTAQMNIANRCARFLDSIGLDDEVSSLFKKLGIKDNNDLIKDFSKK